MESLPSPGVLHFWCSLDVSPQDLGSGWYFRAPERADRRVSNHCRFLIIAVARCAAFLVLPRRLPPGSRLWLVFPSPREGRQEGIESWPSPGVLRFGCSPDVSPQDLGSGWYFRAPERADSICLDHWARLWCSIFSAPQTCPPRTSAPAGISEPREGQQ